MEIKAFKVNIQGLVTGIGFRASVLYEAKKFSNLQGYVRNIFHGEVEVVLQGDIYDVQVMIEWLHHGPKWARIDKIDIAEITINKYLPVFKIAY